MTRIPLSSWVKKGMVSGATQLNPLAPHLAQLLMSPPLMEDASMPMLRVSHSFMALPVPRVTLSFLARASASTTSTAGLHRRASPHDFVLSFAIPTSKDGVDRVTNTDGFTAVGTT